MNKEINLELRSEILEMALTLESTINQLIIVYLNIEHPNPKAISNKSSSFSFRNKLDLLNDLEIVSKEEYLRLLLIMEFRNQFLHNIDCTSFVKAVELLGIDKEKLLLKFDDLAIETDQEFKYSHAYNGLFVYCLNVISDKCKRGREKYAGIREIFTRFSEYSEYLLDMNDEIIEEIMITCLPHTGDDMKVFNFKSKVLSVITESVKKSESSDKHKQLKNRFDSFDQIKIWELFK